MEMLSENDPSSNWQSDLSPNWMNSVGSTGMLGYGNMLKQVRAEVLTVMVVVAVVAADSARWWWSPHASNLLSLTLNNHTPPQRLF